MVTSKCAVRHGLIMDRGLWSLFMTHTILCERIEKMKVIEPKRQKGIVPEKAEYLVVGRMGKGKYPG